MPRHVAENFEGPLLDSGAILVHNGRVGVLVGWWHVLILSRRMAGDVFRRCDHRRHVLDVQKLILPRHLMIGRVRGVVTSAQESERVEIPENRWEMWPGDERSVRDPVTNDVDMIDVLWKWGYGRVSVHTEDADVVHACLIAA